MIDCGIRLTRELTCFIVKPGADDELEKGFRYHTTVRQRRVWDGMEVIKEASDNDVVYLTAGHYSLPGPIEKSIILVGEQDERSLGIL